ncbi:MAG: DUF1365 domain-containing protein [Lysobacteraceae bacterium]
MSLHSAIYTGEVMHVRHAPVAHRFRYPLFMLYLDLAEMPGVFAQRWLWSVNRRNVAAFHRGDFLGDAALPLDEAVRRRYAEVTGVRPTGAIRLLTHLRYFGLSFNPVSFYYCFDNTPTGEQLIGIVAEITNTPWKERHSYVLPVSGAASDASFSDISGFRWQFAKDFHVSPFMPMACHYDWRLSLPDSHLRIAMQVRHGSKHAFNATLNLQRKPLNGTTLAQCLWRFPWMSLRVLQGIHWQALRLWLKGAPVFDHPATPGTTGQ